MVRKEEMKIRSSLSLVVWATAYLFLAPTPRYLLDDAPCGVSPGPIFLCPVYCMLSLLFMSTRRPNLEC